MSLTNKLTKQELKNYVKSLGFVKYKYDDSTFEVPDNENDWGSSESVFKIKDRYLTYVTCFYVSKDRKGNYYIDTNWDKDRKIPYKELPKDMVLDLLNRIAKEWKKAVNKKKILEVSEDFRNK